MDRAGLADLDLVPGGVSSVFLTVDDTFPQPDTPHRRKPTLTSTCASGCCGKVGALNKLINKHIDMKSTLLADCLRTILLLSVAQCVSAQTVASEQPLLKAHAHNDYLHERPLLDALKHGFCSVEADVFLVDGKLLVAHSFLEIRPDRTLEKLYLQPLHERVRQHNGHVYPNETPFTLLIDIKNNGMETYKALSKLLQKYNDVFSHNANGQRQERAATAIISGDRPIKLINADESRIAGIDGRVADIDSDVPVLQMPLISDNWRKHFRWDGKGEIPADEARKLKEIVRKVHAKGRRLRFWATPDTPSAWKVLNEANVDLINTDNLPGLAEFLAKHDLQPATD